MRVGAERPGLPAILAAWYDEGGARRGRTLRLLAPLSGRGGLEPVLTAILALPGSDGDPDLITALTVPPMSWAGDLENEYTRRADLLSEHFRRKPRRAREFAATAADELHRLAAEERARTQRRRDSYTA